ncbi:DNA-directed RNA polymerase subunit delta [Oceanobacillus alkalisoli]|uniref:DNA-directed RNA polymerase subunit delta n=1 Tax=Oceanobacillus alkalisoli TaxID=2925113 RepID=UPI001EEFF316|nr:DNA-directed RNA polymerase subunit delta [Oceanobacillus alkalisoli]MCF3942760.1 DNA-directed RNA polymerase subunit delta [Oceanobacillus alkalisoli]MCG5102731.1 DNA-directed RNA polymerase subunit delta [Oceanobacillus alkalisoli]
MLDQYSREELKGKSMLVLASLILKDTKKALDFQELYNQIAELKGLTKQAKENQIAQFYTELNVDGRFITLGSNVWGLKEWYPVDQADEQITAAPKKRKKKKADEFDEEELEYEADLVELGEEEEEEVVDEIDEFDEDYDEDLDEEEEEELEVEIDLDDEEDEE